ncbi:chromosomal replication initiator protein DnaA [Lysobacteraceae bacterium NML95-0200]|nr:chromosomal replication initiator protein DnaA [Xanthomonadaceae bacterium NML95-0200]
MTSSLSAPPDTWVACLERLSSEVPAEALHSWLKPLQARVQGGVLHLFAPNTFVLEEVREHHLDRIRELAIHLGGLESVELKIGSLAVPSQTHTPAPTPPVTGKTIEEPFESHLDNYFTFDNFVEGRSNSMARAAALLAAQNPGNRQNNPVLLFGGTGLGKTHLMVAAGNLIRQNNPKARVLYLRADDFFNRFFRALQEDYTNKNSLARDRFKRSFTKVDALLIDDVHLLAEKPSTQEEFFHTFNTLFDNKRQIILTSDRYPREIDKLEPRLRSRMSNGLAVAIDPPDFETRAQIVLAKARERNTSIPEDVVMMLAKRMQSNVRELEGALNSLVARANLMGQAITMEFANDTLRDLFRSQQAVINIPNIQKVVADHYSLQLRVLLSDTRKRTIARARQMAMALARELTDRSLPEIGEAFGRDHSTVMNACKVITHLRETDAAVHEDWEKLTRKLTE